ncbi:NADH:ubiquinone oxidoreductase [Meridianimarinicoccus roseus]|jgi:NADH-quinone oxidoreductase subunit E|uniref:NADH:ubiquinone oxidoreductase n=1 Tax=Meridianimarinicoccus roseus TaxID=2072018 RepID=UPI0026887D6F
MRLERNSGAVLIETGMFAGMVGVVAGVMLMVVFAKGFIAAIFAGVIVAAIVFVAMWLMMRGTLEAPRGPGNIAPNKTAIGQPVAASKANSAAKAAAPTAKAEAPADGGGEDIGTKPQMLEAPRGDGPDDLKRIKGVGPKLEELMHSMGFYHFDQIAAWTEDEIAWVDENLIGFKGRVTRDDWVTQARELAAETS